MRPAIQNAIDLLSSDSPESVDAALAILQNTVFSFSMKVCGHREDAEDTMQETLLRAARQLPNFESPEALAVWLYKVARSRCLMSRRRSKFAPQQHLSLEEVLPDRAQSGSPHLRTTYKERVRGLRERRLNQTEAADKHTLQATAPTPTSDGSAAVCVCII